MVPLPDCRRSIVGRGCRDNNNRNDRLRRARSRITCTVSVARIVAGPERGRPQGFCLLSNVRIRQGAAFRSGEDTMADESIRFPTTRRRALLGAGAGLLGGAMLPNLRHAAL